MDWQQAAALAVVAVTALLMGWRWWRARRQRGVGGCPAGCCEGGTEAPRVKLTLSVRRGERPVVRMDEV